MENEGRSWSVILSSLQERFPDDLRNVEKRKGMIAVICVKPEGILRIAKFLRDEGTFEHCAMVCGVDWIDRFEVIYHLWSDALKGYLELSVEVGEEDPHVDSVSGLWYGANWHERETWDMLGVRFDGHPDLRRVLMPEGYRFHPLRKSFELHEPEQLEVKARHV